jgi:hypothetical protein
MRKNAIMNIANNGIVIGQVIANTIAPIQSLKSSSGPSQLVNTQYQKRKTKKAIEK